MSSLTINQEKKIRKDREESKNTVHYHELARLVVAYRRAQKNTGPGGAAIRQELIADIDKCLAALELW